MPACPRCQTDIPETSVFCPRCSAPTPWGSDVTHLITDTPAPAPPSAPSGGASGVTTTRKKSVSSTSWLSTTDAIDHGRFAPGAIFDERYRIIGRIGKGGMGEVYRADDLKLGQPVALKFLPEDLDRDPARLTQLHGEVRMARQVSHPNVCRVYDVGEYEGHTFLSMEYVDGEDLASLLRRIGRFPQDRAIEISRQICAGLAAAHDRGVVHRDLKPANIMLDGSGRIRITDFGLAGAAGEALRAGTPAYMPPEQLAGGDVTPRSDIYALGLVLFEIFTGRRALEGRNLAEMIAKREQDGIARPSEIVRDLDPAIDRAIMRCLESNPAHRPASALSVAAALPGGDPLAAALAAGETPSPEMVAAAGTTSALRAWAAFAALGVTVVLLFAMVTLNERTLVTSLTPLPKPPILLIERAKQILSSIGQGADTVDTAYGFVANTSYLQYLDEHKDLPTRTLLAAGRPAAIQFWFRGSPTVMLPPPEHDRVGPGEPAFAVSGMTYVVVDDAGRLMSLEVLPPQRDAAHKVLPVDYKPLFEAAELDMSAFTPVPAEWTPRGFADTRAAWTGPLPGLADQTLRIEAAGYGGKPVYFQLLGPWSRPTRMAQTVDERRHVDWASVIATLITFSMFVAAGAIARHNVKKGRADRRGAFQLAVFVSVVAFAVWLLHGKHVADPSTEMNRLFTGQPLWAAALLWMLYLAVEPYVRRFWPSTVVSWSRMMAGQLRDPLVGRDILFGVALGVLIRVISIGSDVLTAHMLHTVSASVPSLDYLLATNVVLAQMGNSVFNAVLNGIFAVFGMVLMKLIFRREWLAGTVAVTIVVLVSVKGAIDSGTPIETMATVALLTGIIVLTIQRLGLLAMVALSLISYMLGNALVTLDPSKWFFANSMLVMLVPAALACYGFYASRGGEPIFGRAILE